MSSHRGMFVLIGCVVLGLPTGAGVAQPATRNVVLITVDGLRWQEVFAGADSSLVSNERFVDDPAWLTRRFWDDDPRVRRRRLMPFFWETIALEGQLYGNRLLDCAVDVTNAGRFSYPGYNEILTGFADDRIDSNDKVPNPNTTVLEYLNRMDGFMYRVAAFGSWDVFPFIINEERSGVPVNAGFEPAAGDLSDRELFLNELQEEIPSPWRSVRLDAFTHHYALEYVARKHPRVLYIAYGETDDFAHDGDYAAYLEAAHRTDRFIGAVWDRLQSDPFYQGVTTMLITTDHGRGAGANDAWQHHGADVAGAAAIWMAAIGPDTPPHGEVEGPCRLFQDQIAATITALLGLPYHAEHPAGAPIRAVFSTE